MSDERKSLVVELVKDPEVTGRRLTFNVMSRTGFSDDQLKRHISALELAELVVNSKEFKEKVLAKKFTSTTLTSKQVYDKLMTGEETLRPGKDYELNIAVTMYESNNKTVGYTYPNTVMTWVNNKFFKQYTLGEIAGNAVHEALHKLGFDHSSATDYSSVPYFIGYLVRDMVTGYEKGTQKLTDLYPVVTVPGDENGTPVVEPKPDPVVVPPVETKTKVCYRHGFLWLKKSCYYK